MEVRVRRRGDTVERDVLVGMVASTEFLRRIRRHWRPEWHGSDLARRVAGWCVEHLDRYGRAPAEEIRTRWEDFAASPEAVDADVADVERVLELASREHEERGGEINVDYLVDRAERWARGRELERLREELEGDLGAGDVEAAARAASSLSLPRIGGRQTWADPGDREAKRLAYERTYRPLVALPGSLGQLLNPQLYREAMVSFLAPEKRGKTSLLLEMAYNAARGRLNVAFFSIGDMSDVEMAHSRWDSLLTGLPADPDDAGTRWIPVLDCAANQLGECPRDGRTLDDAERAERVAELKDSLDGALDAVERNLPTLPEEVEDHEPCAECAGSDWWIGAAWWRRATVRPLTWKAGLRACRKFDRKHGAGRVRFLSWPNRAASVEDLERELDDWESDGWTADVVVIDYADNLVPAGREDFRHRVNTVWQEMRRVSQQRRVLLLTATQADAAARERGDMSAGNFSEDKRKQSHVTAEVAVNQDAEEERRGILRLGFTMTRRGRKWVYPLHQVAVLGDQARGRVLADRRASWWVRKDGHGRRRQGRKETR